MSDLVSSRDIDIGDRIDLPGRGVIVTDNQPEGLSVMWFTPEGLGPYTALLPHCKLHKVRYHDERNGEQTSWWETHPDITGKTGEA